jgi:transposase
MINFACAIDLDDDDGSGVSRAKANKTEGEHRGDVLEVARELLAGGRSDDLISLVTKLVEQNEDLATRAALATSRADAAASRAADLQRQLERLQSRYKKNEAVSRAQLVLLIDAMARGEAGDVPTDQANDDDPRAEANDRLRDASGIAEAHDDEPKTKQPRERPSRRQPAPPHLPRVPNPLMVPAAERPCPRCGTERTCIGHETTEVIDLIPAQVIVRRDTREKLACSQCEAELVRAPLGDKVVPGGKLGDALVIDLFVGKYSDGLPLHRQKERFARLGLDLAVSTLCDQIMWIADLLRPLWRAAIAECIGSKVMHLDATGLPVLDHGAPGGKRIGALWGYVGDAVAAYLFVSTGGAKGKKEGEMGPEDILALREGYTVADASNVFDASFQNNPKLVECGCNMHGRRYYVKALDAGDKRAALPIAAYKKLYEIEEEIRELDPDAKLAVRQAQSKPVFDELVAWAKTHQPYEPPTSKLGEAIRYLLNHRVALGRFLEAALVPMDNGAVERLHVRAALTRKNYLFAGSDAGGERAAIAYTILGCCRIAGVNPIEYLREVLPLLARRIQLIKLPELLPAAWKARRAQAVAGQ